MSVVDQAKRGEIIGALSERFGKPANDGERGKYARAATLLVQAGATTDEVFALADAAEERWPGAEVTPLAIANNVTLLRQPERKRKSDEPRGFEGIRAAFADLDPRRALG